MTIQLVTRDHVGPQTLRPNAVLDGEHSGTPRPVDEPNASTPSDSAGRFAEDVNASVARSEGTVWVYAPADGSAAGSGQMPAAPLLPDQIRLLHATQQQEVEQMLSDLGAVVIEPAQGGGRPITLGELRSRHEQQERALESAHDDEIAIPSRSDGSPALTVGDLRGLHERQNLALAENANSDDMVIFGPDAGTLGMTRSEVEALHERQRGTIAAPTDVMAEYPALMLEGGSYQGTVDQLLELHRTQSGQ